MLRHSPSTISFVSGMLTVATEFSSYGRTSSLSGSRIGSSSLFKGISNGLQPNGPSSNLLPKKSHADCQTIKLRLKYFQIILLPRLLMAAFEHFLAFEFQGSHAEPSDSPISRLQGAASMHPAE